MLHYVTTFATSDPICDLFFFSGFIAPEYIGRGCLSIKSDVYSFGVTLLQIISRKRLPPPPVALSAESRDYGPLNKWVSEPQTSPSILSPSSSNQELLLSGVGLVRSWSAPGVHRSNAAWRATKCRDN